MTEIEELINIFLPDFLVYLDALESSKIVQKELDNKENPSIHCDVETN